MYLLKLNLCPAYFTSFKSETLKFLVLFYLFSATRNCWSIKLTEHRKNYNLTQRTRYALISPNTCVMMLNKEIYSRVIRWANRISAMIQSFSKILKNISV